MVTKLAGYEFTKFFAYNNEGEIIAIRALNVRKGHLDLTDIKRIDRDISDSLNRSKLFENDILLTYTGTIGEVAMINQNDIFHLAPNVAKITVHSDHHPMFFYWFFRSSNFISQLNNFRVGSTQPTIPMKTIRQLSVPIPPLPEQKSIAATLSALDDKIELNNRINKTLEEMAQALFKQWFVDFEFPDENGQQYKSSGGEMEESELGLIPKGWKVGCIGNYAKIKSGFAFKSSWWQASGVPVIKIKEISDATINFNNVSFVAEDKIQTAKEFYVTGGELLIAMTGATIGKFALVPKIKQGALVNQRVGKFFLGNSPLKKAGFLYCLLKKEEIFNEIVSRGDGSAQPNISPTAIETIKIVYPSEYYILQFNHAVYSSFEMIISNMYENSKLEKLRDALLPKLMSGEIRVPIEEVAADV